MRRGCTRLTAVLLGVASRLGVRFGTYLIAACYQVPSRIVTRLLGLIALPGLFLCPTPSSWAGHQNLGRSSQYTKADSLFRNGLSLGLNGDLDGGIAALTEALRLKPNWAEVYYDRGAMYGRKGDQGRAIADFTEAIRLDPSYGGAYYSRAMAYGTGGDDDRAYADINKAISIPSFRHDSQYAWAYCGRGAIYARRGDRAAALKDFNRAIQIDPSFAEAYYDRGLEYKKVGDVTRAIADYTKAIRFRKRFAEAYDDRGNALRELWHYDRAISDYNKAIEIRPEFADAYGNRAISWYEVHRYDKALADLNKCKSLGGHPDPGLAKLLDQEMKIGHQIRQEDGRLPSGPSFSFGVSEYPGFLLVDVHGVNEHHVYTAYMKQSMIDQMAKDTGAQPKKAAMVAAGELFVFHHEGVTSKVDIVQRGELETGNAKVVLLKRPDFKSFGSPIPKGWDVPVYIVTWLH